ncbi:geranylgeranyl pyrophosphate synthase [Desulfitispora alkaliphila]|uniref:hypothetical protein n=1 Tax=Desulfitispora alkaliphila TaxID=622674 RepID=UPI003D1DFE9D
MEQRAIDRLRPQISQIQTKINDEMKYNGKDIVDFFNYRAFEDCIPTALLLAFAYNDTGEELEENLAELASVVHLIGMSTNVHDDVTEDSNSAGQILVGDLLYGKFYLALCNANYLEFLKPLGEIICDIHQAKIDKLRGKGNCLDEDILIKEYGNFISICCKLGAHWGGLNHKDQLRAEEIGLNIGVYIQAKKSEYSFPELDKYLLNAKQLIQQLNSIEIRDNITAIIDFLTINKLGSGNIV